MTKTDTSVVTDWRIRDEDLADIPPGKTCERVITPQRHSLLRQIVVRHLQLAWLQIGNVIVPFEICGENGAVRTYRPIATDIQILRQLANTGAQVLARHAIRVVAGLDVRVILRNDGASPKKPIVSLIVQEEAS